jgi:hypothetical protein
VRTIVAETPVWRGDPKISREMGRQAAPREKVRKRRLRLFWQALVLAIFAAGAFKAGQVTRAFVARDPAFRLRAIVVEGPLRHDPAPLRDVLSDLEGRSLLEIGADDVSQRLALFPWVKGFLCRKHYPHTLTVEVTERPQLCAVNAGGRVVEIDGYGHVWPALPGVPGVFEAPGSDPADLGFQALVEALLRADLSGKVTGIAPSTGGSFLLTAADGAALRVSASLDLAPQWERYQRARAWIEENAPGPRVIDLRWDGRVVLETPGAPEAAAGETPSGESKPAGKAN